MSRLDGRFEALQVALANREVDSLENNGESVTAWRDSNAARSRNAQKISEILLSWSVKEVRDFLTLNSNDLSEGELSAVSLALSKLEENEVEMSAYIEGRKKYSKYSKLLSRKMREYDLDDELLTAVRTGDRYLIAFVFDQKLESGTISDLDYVFFKSGACHEDLESVNSLFLALEERGFDFSSLPPDHAVSIKFLGIAKHRPWMLPILTAFGLNLATRDVDGKNLLQIASLAWEPLDFKLVLLEKMGEEAAFDVSDGRDDVWMTFLFTWDSDLWERFIDFVKIFSPAKTIDYLNAANNLPNQGLISYFLSKVPLPTWTKATSSIFPWYRFESSTVNASSLTRGIRNGLEEELMSSSARAERIAIEAFLMEKLGIDLWTESFKRTVFLPLEWWKVSEYAGFRGDRAINYVKTSPSWRENPLENAMRISEGLRSPTNSGSEEIRKFSKREDLSKFRDLVLEFIRFWELEYSACTDTGKRSELSSKAASLFLSMPLAFAFRPDAISVMKKLSKVFRFRTDTLPAADKMAAFRALVIDSGWSIGKASEIMELLGVGESDKDCHLILSELQRKQPKLLSLSEDKRKVFFSEWSRFFVDSLSHGHRDIAAYSAQILDSSPKEISKLLSLIFESEIKSLPEDEAEMLIDLLATPADWKTRFEKSSYEKLVSKIHPNVFMHVERRFHWLIRPDDKHPDWSRFSVRIPDGFLFELIDKHSMNLRHMSYRLSIAKDSMPLAMALFIDTYGHVGRFSWSEQHSAYSLSVNKGTYDAPRTSSIRMLWEVLKRTNDAFAHNSCWFSLADLWNSGFIARTRNPHELWKMFDENPTVSAEIQHSSRALMESYFRKPSASVPQVPQLTVQKSVTPTSSVFGWIKKVLK